MIENKFLKRFIEWLLVWAPACFTIFIYVPTAVIVGNIGDFDLYYQTIILTQLRNFALAVFLLSIVFSVFPEKISHVLQKFTVGLTAAFLVQNQFMNNNMQLLAFAEQDNSESLFSKIVNTLIWLIILALPFVAEPVCKKVKESVDFKKILKTGAVILLAFQIVFVAASLITAPKELFERYLTYSFDPEEQYTVSSDENIIFLVVDSYDLRYAQYFYNNQPEVYDGLKDFTFYDDACSVFDKTIFSMNQTFGGCPFDNSLTEDEWMNAGWGSENTTELYSRLHENNYKVNFYNYDAISLEYLDGKVDNLVKSEGIKLINKPMNDSFYFDIVKLSFYNVMPNIAKPIFDVSNIDFKAYSSWENFAENDFLNEEFEAKIDTIHTADNDCKYMVVNRIYGTHYPCATGDYTSESLRCLELVTAYIEKLKEIGVYDNSTIIIMSDHGEHSLASENFFAATPLFMVKRAGETHDEIQVNSYPMYYTDILPSIAVWSGIVDENSGDNIFGESIYDFDEDSVRTRTWYDTRKDPEYPMPGSANGMYFAPNSNVWYGYTFTGTVDVLRANADNRTGYEVYQMTESYG